MKKNVSGSPKRPPGPPAAERGARGSAQRALGAYLRYSHIGLQFVLCFALPVFGGVWLDRTAGTLVLFTLLGTALGFGAAVYTLYIEVYRQRPSSDEAAEDAAEHAAEDAADEARDGKARPGDGARGGEPGNDELQEKERDGRR